MKVWIFVLLFSVMPYTSYPRGIRKISTNHAIVLSHGINNYASSFKEMQEALEKVFPHVQVIALTSAEGINSVMIPIEDQATAAFLELKEKIKDIKNTAILLIGSSQGGIRVYSMLQTYAHELNIKGLIAIGVPWEGAPLARVTTKLVWDRFTKKIRSELRLLSSALGYVPEQLETNFITDIQTVEETSLWPGLKNLMEESDLLKQIAQTLPKVTIPVLSIASKESSFETLFNLSSLKGKLKNFSKLYTWLIVGDHNNCKHDMMVPLYSQHALNIVSKRMKNFERYTVSQVCHSLHLLGVALPQGKYMLSNPHVIKKVIQFSKRCLLN